VVRRELGTDLQDEAAFGLAVVDDCRVALDRVSRRAAAARHSKAAIANALDLLGGISVALAGISLTVTVRTPSALRQRPVLSDQLFSALEATCRTATSAGRRGVILCYDEAHLLRDSANQRQYPLSALLAAGSERALRLSERRSQIKVPTEIALVQVQVAHHHHVAGVAEDSAQPLHLAPLAEVARGEGVAEAVGVDRKADSISHSAQQIGDAHRACRPAVRESERVARPESRAARGSSSGPARGAAGWRSERGETWRPCRA
jgi:hypothetical protein